MRKYNLHIKSCLPAIIIVTVLLMLSSCRDINEHGLFRKRSLKKALLWAQQDSMRAADSLKRALPVSDLIDETFKDSIVVLEEEILSMEDTKNQYYIIIGTFAHPENARLLARKFRKEGYHTSILRITNNYGKDLDMVSVKTFNNYDEALSYIKEYHSKVDSTAWLYQNI